MFQLAGAIILVMLFFGVVSVVGSWAAIILEARNDAKKR